MPTFIENSYCNGARPAGIVGLNHMLRSDLIGLMLKDRHVARFLIAPKGYGKSSVIFEYAQVIFGFEHTFWIKCTSPCFIRDIDNGTIFEQIAAIDGAGSLVVLEDVPGLDPDRVDAFCAFVDRLLDASYEVVVSCVPSVDAFSASQVDKIVIEAEGLVLSDDEIEMERMRGTITVDEASSMRISERAPCLIWGESGGDEILKGIRDEELPSELELAIFAILALRDGEIDDLSRLIPEKRIDEDAEYLEKRYPYLGIDFSAGSFASVNFGVDKVCGKPGFKFAMLSHASFLDGKSAVSFEIADMLVERGQASRACELVSSCEDKESCAEWLSARGWGVLRSCRPYDVAKLAGRIDSKKRPLAPKLCAMAAWAYFMLGDETKARRAAAKAQKSSIEDAETFVAAEILAKRLGSSKDLSRATAIAERNADVSAKSALSRRRACFEMLDWAELLRLEEARAKGAQPFLEACKLVAEGAGMAAATTLDPRIASLLLSASWYFESAPAAASAEGTDEESGVALQASEVGERIRLIDAISTLISGIIDGAKDAERLDWPVFKVVCAIDAIVEEMPFEIDAKVPRALLAKARAVSEDLFEQASKAKRLDAQKKRSKPAPVASAIASYSGGAKDADGQRARIATPTLNVSLFGGLEVWVGPDKQDIRTIRRKNAKIALSLFAISHGREVTKERVAETLWPQATLDASTKNFYVVWAYMKRILAVGGSCPYLVRTQSGYRLDFRYVATDVERFESLCKSLMFGREESMMWEDMFNMVSNDFADDLLPGIRDNELIDTMRLRYRTQLVDGLVAASARLVLERESRGAIWFAREATRRDNTREDAYIALMEAQIGSHQRGAALETYFNCRRHLSEQLGIDPSPRIVELYRSIIEAEEDF